MGGGGGGGGKRDRTEARVHNDFMKHVNDVRKKPNGTNVQFKKPIDGKIYCKA